MIKISINLKNELKYIARLLLILFLALMFSVLLKNTGVEKESIIMVLLLGVLFVPIVTKGYIYGSVAAVISVLLFNYLFTVPIHTFMIYNSSDMTLMLFFFAVSLISSSLTSRSKKQLELAQKNERTAKLLYSVTESFLKITGEKNIVMQGIKNIYKHTGYICSVTLFENNRMYFDKNIDKNNEKTMLEIDIQGVSKKLGKIGIFNFNKTFKLEDELLIKMVAGQMGIALDREFIYNERENIRIAMEKERLRGNLLRGISHDIRTPLTAIVGASGVIVENRNILDNESVQKLASDINEEALWLNHLVENILNMTRIGDESLVINKNEEVVDDIIDAAVSRISKFSGNRNIEVSMPNEVIVLMIDGKLIVQVLTNILDNAIKHTKEDGNIYLRVRAEGDYAVFEIEDDGEGIPEEIKDTLFERFVTAKGNVIDGKRGMGLGLSICEAFVKANGGKISAENSQHGGAVFRFSLPLIMEE